MISCIVILSTATPPGGAYSWNDSNPTKPVILSERSESKNPHRYRRLRMWSISFTLCGTVAPQRLLTSERATRVELKPFASLDTNGTLLIRPPDSLITTAEQMARTDPDRRFRCESMRGLSVIRIFGAPEQQQRVSAFFDELAAHPDEMTALCASWGRDGRDIEANREGIKGWYDLE